MRVHELVGFEALDQKPDNLFTGAARVVSSRTGLPVPNVVVWVGNVGTDGQFIPYVSKVTDANGMVSFIDVKIVPGLPVRYDVKASGGYDGTRIDHPPHGGTVTVPVMESTQAAGPIILAGILAVLVAIGYHRK